MSFSRCTKTLNLFTLFWSSEFLQSYIIKSTLKNVCYSNYVLMMCRSKLSSEQLKLVYTQETHFWYFVSLTKSADFVVWSCGTLLSTCWHQGPQLHTTKVWIFRLISGWCLLVITTSTRLHFPIFQKQGSVERFHWAVSIPRSLCQSWVYVTVTWLCFRWDQEDESRSCRLCRWRIRK